MESSRAGCPLDFCVVVDGAACDVSERSFLQPEGEDCSGGDRNDEKSRIQSAPSLAGIQHRGANGETRMRYSDRSARDTLHDLDCRSPSLG